MVLALILSAASVYVATILKLFSLLDSLETTSAHLRLSQESAAKDRRAYLMQISRLQKSLDEEKEITAALVDYPAVGAEMDRLDLLDEIDDMTEGGPEYGIGI